MRLEEFLAQIAKAGTLAQQIASEYPKQRLQRASDKDGDVHHLRNLKGKVEVEGVTWEFEVPEYNMEEAGVLGLDALKVTLETDITAEETEEGEADIHIGLKRGLFARQSHATLEAEFSFRDPPEIVNVIGDRIVGIFKQNLAQARKDA